MKTEDLEALLIDRTLGELPPGVAELLDAHLARDPAAAATARQLADTVQHARAAMPVPTTGALPPAPTVPWLRPAAPWRSVVRETVKFAAVLTLGLALGWQFRAGPPATAAGPTPTVAIVTRPAPESAASTAPSSTGGFWSLARVEAEARHQAAAAQSSNRLQLHWTSPVKMPRLESPGEKS